MLGLVQILLFMKTSKNYWLMKSEPETWSWEQQKKKKIEHWGWCSKLSGCELHETNEKRRSVFILQLCLGKSY